MTLKNWNGRDATTEADDTWGNGDGKGGQQFEWDGDGDRARVWWGGGNDRHNDMVARGSNRNTFWKNIKTKVEETMRMSTVTYQGVKVIGQMASFAIIRFDTHEDKQEFKRWLQKYGQEVKKGAWSLVWRECG